MASQLATMSAMELRSLLCTALKEIRPIEAKRNKKKKDTEKFAFGIAGAIIMIVVFGIAEIIGIGFTINGLVDYHERILVSGITTLLIATGGITLGIVLLKKLRTKARAVKQKIDKEIVQHLQRCRAIHVFHKDYRNTRTLNYMIALLDKGRATTWMECADKYEEQKHRWAVEINAARAAAAAEEAAYEASRAANAAEAAWRK